MPLESPRLMLQGDMLRLAAIPPGKLKKIKLDARRDEETGKLHATWNGQPVQCQPTQYVLWECPDNYTVRLGPDGKFTVKKTNFFQQ
jgi:hypothetical protein